MVARDVVAIARLQMRDNSEPRIVALFPQLEELDATAEAGAAASSSSSSSSSAAGAADAPAGMQRVPPGLVVVQLPFADDMRVVKQAVADVTGECRRRRTAARPVARCHCLLSLAEAVACVSHNTRLCSAWCI
jgi:hypothetical protein